MSAARRELYVYYRVAEAHWLDAARAVQAWQRQLCNVHAGLTARVLRRPDVRDGTVTLMEVYGFARGSAIAAAFEADLADADAVLGSWLVGGRHVERFDPFD